MKQSGIIRKHLNRKIAALLLATMLLDQFPVTVIAEPLSPATGAGAVMEEQAGPETAVPTGEEETVPTEPAPAGEEKTVPEAPAGEEQTGSEKAEPAG